MIFEYAHEGGTTAVRLERLPDGRFEATIDGRTSTFAAAPVEGGWRLELGDRVVMVYAAADGPTRHVQADSVSATLTRIDNQPRRRQRAATGGDLSAQMPGQVTAVLVSPGDTVERGQALVVLEAMKMEMRVTAPQAGRVRRLLVAEGDLVERGQLLVELEDDPVE